MGSPIRWLDAQAMKYITDEVRKVVAGFPEVQRHRVWSHGGKGNTPGKIEVTILGYNGPMPGATPQERYRSCKLVEDRLRKALLPLADSLPDLRLPGVRFPRATRRYNVFVESLADAAFAMMFHRNTEEQHDRDDD